MTNEKPTAVTTHAAQAPIAASKSPGKKKDVQVISLEIDENDDLGGDPYNHTGSFCVPEFSDD